MPGQQTLVWDAENRLSQARDGNGDLLEQYWYDVGGARVKKVTSGTTTTYTFFGHYEEEVTGGVTTAISHYSFGGLRIAVKRGSDLYHLHGDHLGSASLTTDGAGAAIASRAYYAYGAERSASGDLQTDHTFTGQKSDATGLLYYNARYYDPALGTFISPDTIIPDPGRVIDYNRFLYVRGSPPKYMDPGGLIAVCFRGGSKNHEENPTSNFSDMCMEAIDAVGYNEYIHGEILTLTNGRDAIDTAYARIYEAKVTQKLTEPVILLGFSWGAASAITLAEKLNNVTPKFERLFGIKRTIEVDLLFAVDTEPNLRGLWGDTPRLNSAELPPNVRLGVYLAAKNGWRWRLGGMSFVSPDNRFNPQDGMNYLGIALNIELEYVKFGTQDDLVRVDHNSMIHLREEELNPVTLAYMEASINVALNRRR